MKAMHLRDRFVHYKGKHLHPTYSVPQSQFNKPHMKSLYKFKVTHSSTMWILTKKEVVLLLSYISLTRQTRSSTVPSARDSRLKKGLQVAVNNIITHCIFLYGNTRTDKCKPCKWAVWEARKGRWHIGAKNTERQEVSRGFSTEHHENTTAMWNHLMLRLTPTHTYPAGWHAAILFSFSFLSCCCLKHGGGKHGLSEWTKKKQNMNLGSQKKATCKVCIWDLIHCCP